MSRWLLLSSAILCAQPISVFSVFACAFLLKPLQIAQGIGDGLTGASRQIRLLIGHRVEQLLHLMCIALFAKCIEKTHGAVINASAQRREVPETGHCSNVGCEVVKAGFEMETRCAGTVVFCSLINTSVEVR